MPAREVSPAFQCRYSSGDAQRLTGAAYELGI